jgi:hypothetical protein
MISRNPNVPAWCKQFVNNDRGHLGEFHGRSTEATERVRNGWGVLVGSDRNLKSGEHCAHVLGTSYTQC